MWVDAGTEFKGSFITVCQKNEIEVYKTLKSAERNIRSLKNLIYKYLEDKWTYSYISQLQSFVQTNNSRVNRVTKLAPNKVTKKDVPYMLSVTFNASATLVRQTKIYSGDFVPISIVDLPFRKGCKQTFTNKIEGKFYELEFVKFRDNSSELTKNEWIHGSLSFISLYEYFFLKAHCLHSKIISMTK